MSVCDKRIETGLVSFVKKIRADLFSQYHLCSSHICFYANYISSTCTISFSATSVSGIEATLKIIMVDISAITAKDHCKLVACAIKPTMGGTSKKPRYPMVDTAANDCPVFTFFIFPAMLNTNGTMQDTPRPTI